MLYLLLICPVGVLSKATAYDTTFLQSSTTQCVDAGGFELPDTVFKLWSKTTRTGLTQRPATPSRYSFFFSPEVGFDNITSALLIWFSVLLFVREKHTVTYQRTSSWSPFTKNQVSIQLMEVSVSRSLCKQSKLHGQNTKIPRRVNHTAWKPLLGVLLHHTRRHSHPPCLNSTYNSRTSTANHQILQIRHRSLLNCSVTHNSHTKT